MNPGIPNMTGIAYLGTWPVSGLKMRAKRPHAAVAKPPTEAQLRAVRVTRHIFRKGFVCMMSSSLSQSYIHCDCFNKRSHCLVHAVAGQVCPSRNRAWQLPSASP